MVAVVFYGPRVSEKLVVAYLVKTYASFAKGESALIAYEPFVGLCPQPPESCTSSNLVFIFESHHYISIYDHDTPSPPKFLLYRIFQLVCFTNTGAPFYPKSLTVTSLRMFQMTAGSYKPDRVEAGIYLLFCTLLASLPLLVYYFG